MKGMRNKLPVGRYPAPVAPFSAKGDFMGDAFAEIIRYYADNGAKGFLIAGDNGEAWALTPKEIAAMTAITMRETKGRMPVFVGAWAISERETIERAEAAASAGAYGLCIKPQFYIHTWAPASKADIVRRFEVVAKAVPLPVMAYNSPNRTSVNITQDVLRAICDVCNVEVLKDTNHDVKHQIENVLQFHDKMCVLVSGAAFITGMMLGAGGTIGTGMDLFGKDADRIFDFPTMGEEERRRLYRMMTEVSHVIHATGVVPAGYKAACNMIGLPAGHLREPLQPLSREEEARIREVLVRYGAIPEGKGRRSAAE